jgi:hypothetical protein
VAHEPADGRPAIWKPVCRNFDAGSWLTCSVCIVLMMQRSSTMPPTCFIASLTIVPVWPYFLNAAIGPTIGYDVWPFTIVDRRRVPRTESGSSSPCILASVGLKSNVSFCENAPSMCR